MAACERAWTAGTFAACKLEKACLFRADSSLSVPAVQTALTAEVSVPAVHFSNT